MKYLAFTEDLSAQIIAGQKTRTWRLFDDKDLAVGDELVLKNKTSGRVFARARISFLYEKTLGSITDDDFDGGHEKYSSFEEMMHTFRTYYGNAITEDTVVKIIDFEILEFYS
jgi:hypothetical protein